MGKIESLSCNSFGNCAGTMASNSIKIIGAESEPKSFLSSDWETPCCNASAVIPKDILVIFAGGSLHEEYPIIAPVMDASVDETNRQI